MLEFEEQIRALPDDDSANWEMQMWFYWTIRAMKPTRCFEIGTHRGKTTLYMAHALYDNGHGIIHTADPRDWGQVENFQKFHDLALHIAPHLKAATSVDVQDIDFLFVDGLHEAVHVREEMNYFFPRLTKEAVVVFHDCGGDNSQVGVNDALREVETTWLPLGGKVRIYSPFKDYPYETKN